MERVKEVSRLLSRFVPVTLESPLLGSLTKSQQSCVTSLIRAAAVMDELWAKQMWSGSDSFFSATRNFPEDSDLSKYISINKGPWSELDEGHLFITKEDISMDIPISPPDGANFYPEDMSKEEYTNWVESLPSESEQRNARGYFHVIRRDQENNLITVPYSDEYNMLLSKAAEHVKTAADVCENESLKTFLSSRATSFLSNDYYQSDIDWINVDSPIHVTMGPYEVYRDKLFAAKASYEAFIGIRDDIETKKLEVFQSMMQELEDHLPLDAKYKNTNVNMNTPIKVIQLIYAGGDVGGCQTIAFCLPNDERVVKAYGSKLVLMKNVSAAKHDLIMEPIAKECVCAKQRNVVKFDSFFTHTLCHECCHSIGPHDLYDRTVRQAMEEHHSALEEAKADIVGLWALQYLMDKGMIVLDEDSVYVSFMVGAIRSIRFGLDEAHGKGLAVQFNYLFEKGAFLFDEEEKKFKVDFVCVKEHVAALARIILTIQAEGNKANAATFLATHAIISPELQICLDRLEDVPVDIVPKYPAASFLKTET